MKKGFNDNFPPETVEIPCDRIRELDDCIEELFAAVEDQADLARNIGNIVCEVSMKFHRLGAEVD
jgi:hypothetical protein